MFLSNPFFYYFITILVLLILIYISSIFIQKNKMKLLYQELLVFANKNNYSLSKSSNPNYDYKLVTDKKTFLISIVNIQPNSSVTINSKDTWCYRYGGGNKKGRSYPNKEYMKNIIPFLRMKVQNGETKLVILYPSTEAILKYVNESDICEVKPEDTPYGYKVTTYQDFYNNFEKLNK